MKIKFCSYLYPLRTFLVMNGLIIGWRSLLAGFKEQEKFVWILCSCLDYQIAPKKSLFLHRIRSPELVVKSLSSLKNNILEVCLKLGPFSLLNTTLPYSILSQLLRFRIYQNPPITSIYRIMLKMI